MSVSDVLGEVEAAGIALRLDGERIRIWFPELQQREELADQVAFLRTHREEVAEFLRGRNESRDARPTYFWGTNRDGHARNCYEWRAHVAIDAICEIAAPEGLITWLSEHSPLSYRQLTRDLPNKISRAWQERIPFEKFEKLCFNLVDTYRHAVELMLASR
jgi:hypothetical protein